MIKHLRILIASLALFMGLGGLVPAIAVADTAQQAVCQSLDAGADCSNSTPNGGVDINHLITAIVNILSVVVGIVAVIMVIVGGFKLITAGGDSNKVASGRNTVLYALIGLVVVAFAQAIVKLVLDKLK